MSTREREDIDGLREVWRYDETVQERIDAAMDTFREYVERRTHHVSLSHALEDEYDPAAVASADRVRTVAHNAAVRAAGDLNRLCGLCGMNPIAPVCPDGIDPLLSKPHRNAIAHYIADVLELGEGERAGMDLR